MPKTIKEVLEYVNSGDLNINAALAEIRQTLKEAEPEKLYGVKITEFRAGHNQAIDEYTANIEKRLG